MSCSRGRATRRRRSPTSPASSARPPRRSTTTSRPRPAILGGLLAQPLTAYLALLDGLESGAATPEDLLGSLIDITADSRDLATIFDRDPAALAIIDEQLPRPSREMTEQTLAVLAGPDPDHAALIRANAALAVVKAATLAALELGGGTLSAADRAEVLAVTLRTLKN